MEGGGLVFNSSSIPPPLLLSVKAKDLILLELSCSVPLPELGGQLAALAKLAQSS